MTELTKSLKRKLREQSMAAHEEELRRALLPLAAKFDQWRQGKVGSGELALIIEDWDRGLQTELSKKYNCPTFITEMNVAHAIVTGLLDEGKVDAELLAYLGRHIALYRQHLQENETTPAPASPGENFPQKPIGSQNHPNPQ